MKKVLPILILLALSACTPALQGDGGISTNIPVIPVSDTSPPLAPPDAVPDRAVRVTVFNTGYSAEEGYTNSRLLRQQHPELSEEIVGSLYTRTVNGTEPDWGTVAVDPGVIPYGSVIYSPKYAELCGRYGIAVDCGSMIKGYHIDWWVETNAQAYWITGYEDVVILRWGWDEWLADKEKWGLE